MRNGLIAPNAWLTTKWPLPEKSREICIRPFTASKVDWTHLGFRLEVLHIQTTLSTSLRQQPSDPHTRRTVSWLNVHRQRPGQRLALNSTFTIAMYHQVDWSDILMQPPKTGCSLQNVIPVSEIIVLTLLASRAKTILPICSRQAICS